MDEAGARRSWADTPTPRLALGVLLALSPVILGLAMLRDAAVRSHTTALSMQRWLADEQANGSDPGARRIALRSQAGDPRFRSAPAWVRYVRTGAPRLSLLDPTPHASRTALSAGLFLPGLEDRSRAVDCLAAAVYYEAGNQPVEGQEAVAQVVLNRVRARGYPKSVCGVVFQGSELPTGCQFTFTCDGSLQRRPSASGWRRAENVAERVISGETSAVVGAATHYHTIWIRPYWSAALERVAQIGAHIFYRRPDRPNAPPAPGMAREPPTKISGGTWGGASPAPRRAPPGRPYSWSLKVVSLDAIHGPTVSPGEPIRLGETWRPPTSGY